MRTRQTLTLAITVPLLIASSACGNSGRKGDKGKDARLQPGGNPAMITSAEDSVRLEQAIADMAGMLHLADDDTRRMALRQLIEEYAADPDALQRIDGLTRKYLDDPNSPLRDEEIFIIYLEALIENDATPDHMRERARFSLTEAKKNRPGTIAADFAILIRQSDKSDRSVSSAKSNPSHKSDSSAKSQNSAKSQSPARSSTLHKSLRQDTTLILFHDPDCQQCRAMIRQLAASPLSTNVPIIAVDVTGDRSRWQRNEHPLPSDWLDTFATTPIEDNDLYTFPALPALYLLAPDATVLLKDFTLQP